ncbi:hypothetical protein BS47DRAFT_1484643 [Hydnum rufescens UP504]|uniref:Uncharacterized protein n=1 Tax=Hydnum rufescens UP504 TaxID=1448309 RepID=A0A9P6DUE1_9AGAM|nr:hypothetical protein BS47DRAFT_1484643 [Hydnum rufescens UP504]
MSVHLPGSLVRSFETRQKNASRFEKMGPEATGRRWMLMQGAPTYNIYSMTFFARQTVNGSRDHLFIAKGPNGEDCHFAVTMVSKALVQLQSTYSTVSVARSPRNKSGASVMGDILQSASGVHTIHHRIISEAEEELTVLAITRVGQVVHFGL